MSFMNRAGRRRSFRFAAGLVTAAALAATLISGGGASQRLDSFAGTCSVQGTDTFTPPATNTLQQAEVVYDASGSCSGTLNGRQVSNAPVTLRHAASPEASCQFAYTTSPGNGVIRFAGGERIHYWVEFTSVLTEVKLSLQGQRSGSATARATFLTPRTPPDVVQQCAGTGAKYVPMDMTLLTQSPLVSERNPAGP
jgi:hypothetical protein